MEIVLFIGFATVLVLMHWAYERWISDSHTAPWLLIVGAVLLVVMAWAWQHPDTRGPSIILTGGSIIALYRAMQILRSRKKHQTVP